MIKTTMETKLGRVVGRVGTAGLAALAVMGAASAASANTSVTVPGTGWSRTYANSSWSQAGSSAGTFGAGVRYTTALASDGQGAVRSSDNTANLDIELFDKAFTFAGVEGKLTTASTTDSSPNEYLGATVGGYTLLSEAVPSGANNSLGAGVTLGEIEVGGVKLDLNVTGSYSFNGFSLCLEASATKDITLGPVPVTITGALDGCPNVAIQSASAGNSSGSPTLSYDMKPGIDTSFTLSAGIGSSDVGSFGLWGSVDIVNYGTDMTSAMTFHPSTADLDYQVLAKESLSSLSGSAGVYVTVGYKALSVTYQRTLVSWDGITWQKQIVLADSVPSASEVQVAIGPTQATGSYVFNDSEHASDSGSTFRWYRALDSSGTNAELVTGDGGTSYTYGWNGYDENDAYLQFCVTPRNSGGNVGAESCSAWTRIGRTLRLFKDINDGGAQKTFAYERGASTSQCVNVGSDFNDVASAFFFMSPANASTTLWLFKDADCSGDRVPQNVPQNKGWNAPQMSAYGSGWNDSLSSFLVVWSETATVTDLNVSVAGNTATADYTFYDSAGLPESGSTYQWYRSVDARGDNPVAISGGKTHTLSAADDGMFLQVCVTPSTGFVTTGRVCSDWSRGVGDLLRIYQDGSFGGDGLFFAYEHSPAGTCFNLPDYSFNDEMSSYEWDDLWTGKAGATVTFYQDADCSGSTFSSSIDPGYNGDTEPSVPSGWNDQASSFRVSWVPSVTISTPSVVVSGDKATSSHAYADTTGRPELSMYQWYRASDGAGTGRAYIGQTWSDAYTLTGAENNQYLQVCVTGGNGVTTAGTKCSGWVGVGQELTLFSEPSLDGTSGTSLHFAYQTTPSGTCYNLSDYGFDDVTRAFLLYTGSLYGQVHFYQAAGCVEDDAAGEYTMSIANGGSCQYNPISLPGGGTGYSCGNSARSTSLGSQWDSTISSFKVVYWVPSP